MDEPRTDADLTAETKKKSSRHIIRFPRGISEILREWAQAHPDEPYPDDLEKCDLQQATGLNMRQINNWFANWRRRSKRRNVPDISRQEPQSALHVDRTSLADQHSDGTVPQVTVDVNTDTVRLPEKMFQCTFCTQTFSTKHDWTRHETSIHLPLKRYICCPFSPLQTDQRTGIRICAYCGMGSPTPEHIASHNHKLCQSRDPDLRIFLRKDHFRQHLRSVHECDLLSHMESWLLEAVYVNSRCGFCGKRFSIWCERNEHIAAHFREGYHMGMWRGCRGLDTAISALVTAAIPPFLIGLTRLNPSPFVMTNHRRKSPANHNERRNDKTWEFLIQGLLASVEENISQARPMSDKDIQDQARLLIYGFPSANTITAADNPEWLDLFKRAYSLGFLHAYSGIPAASLPEDLEVYHDLGIKPPQLSQNQQALALVTLFQNDGPVEKTYRRFTALSIPLQKALPFETMTRPWPDAGILGDVVIVADSVFEENLKAQLSLSFSQFGECDQQIDCEEDEEQTAIFGELGLMLGETLYGIPGRIEEIPDAVL